MNERLVQELIQGKWITSQPVVDCFLKVDRGEFWGGSGNPNAYTDNPQQINYNVVISAPKLHTLVTELLADKLVPGNKVLDIGSGTGILCAAFYQMMKNY